MIISVTPMIAGFSASNVNTRPGGSRWGPTESGPETVRATPRKSNGWTRIKRRAAQGAGNTRTALTRPASLSHKGREGQAVSKPRASFYATRLRRAVTKDGRSVVISTVLVVGGA